MKKHLIIAWILLLLPLRALALIECDCMQQPCACFIQAGDETTPVRAITAFLAEQGYLSAVKSTFDAPVAEAVCTFQREAGLEMTGVLDDETLTRLILGRSVAQMDAQDEALGQCVYIPTDGGKKRHVKATCSGMEDPRKVSARNAQAMGMDACKRCKPQ